MPNRPNPVRTWGNTMPSDPSTLLENEDYATKITLACLLCLIGTLSALANLMVILNNVFNKNLHDLLFDKAIANLALADLLASVLGLPIIVSIYLPELVSFGPISMWEVMLLWTIVDVLTAVSVWHVLFITVDRYIAVKFPGQYQWLKDIKRQWGIVISVWVTISLVIFIPRVILYAPNDSKAEESWR